MSVYEVTAATLEETVPFDDGNMNKFSLSLKGEDGTVYTAESWRKASLGTQPPAEAGDKIEATLENKPRGGLKIKGLKLVGAPSSNGAGSTQTLDYRSDPTGRSIERQVAFKGAIEIAKAVAEKTGTKPDAEAVVAYADELDKFFLPPAPEGTEPVAPDDDIPF
jgi:hypothetical protein